MDKIGTDLDKEPLKINSLSSKDKNAVQCQVIARTKEAGLEGLNQKRPARWQPNILIIPEVTNRIARLPTITPFPNISITRIKNDKNENLLT